MSVVWDLGGQKQFDDDSKVPRSRVRTRLGFWLAKDPFQEGLDCRKFVDNGVRIDDDVVCASLVGGWICRALSRGLSSTKSTFKRLPKKSSGGGWRP